MNRLFSLSLRPCIVLFLLSVFFMSAFAQDDLFTTVSSSSGKAGSETNGVSAAVSPPVAVQPVAPAPLPSAPPVASMAQPVATGAEKEVVEKREQELLRDPFWPVGFFPENWHKKASVPGSVDTDMSGWKTAAAKIIISGTSKLGGRTAAIVNGELKSIDDQVEVLSEGKTYQWKIVGIEADGRIQLKKLGIK